MKKSKRLQRGSKFTVPGLRLKEPNRNVGGSPVKLPLRFHRGKNYQ